MTQGRKARQGRGRREGEAGATGAVVLQDFREEERSISEVSTWGKRILEADSTNALLSGQAIPESGATTPSFW